MKSLLLLITKSPDSDAQRFSALALANACSAAYTRGRIAAEGAVQVLIDYIRSDESDMIGRQYCAMALGNLAAEPDNHMEIVKSDGEILIDRYNDGVSWARTQLLSYVH